MRSAVWMSEPSHRASCERLLASVRARAVVEHVEVPASLNDLLDLARDPKTVLFVDQQNFAAVAMTKRPPAGPMIVFCDEALPTAIGWLGPNPWLAHVMSSSMLDHPIAEEHIANLLQTLASSRKPRLLDWFSTSIEGRRVRLTHSNRREARIERMSGYFEAKNVQPRTLEMLRDAAEELLTNAFYDAPVAAGALKKAVSRTQEIALPEDNACDLAYGCRDDLAIVRIRDPFGSLSRSRLVEVLERCAQAKGGVQVDETMGGAGLGMWRLFSGATFVGISVIKGSHTEVMVGVAKRAPGPRPFAFHLFFRDSEKRRFWQLADDDTSKAPLNQSVMIPVKAK